MAVERPVERSGVHLVQRGARLPGPGGSPRVRDRNLQTIPIKTRTPIIPRQEIDQCFNYIDLVLELSLSLRVLLKSRNVCMSTFELGEMVQCRLQSSSFTPYGTLIPQYTEFMNARLVYSCYIVYGEGKEDQTSLLKYVDRSRRL